MEENNEVVAETTGAPANNNVQISIEQICAAIISTLGSVDVPLQNLIANYSAKSISVNQDPETKTVTFGLVDNAVAEEEQKSE